MAYDCGQNTGTSGIAYKAQDKPHTINSNRHPWRFHCLRLEIGLSACWHIKTCFYYKSLCIHCWKAVSYHGAPELCRRIEVSGRVGRLTMHPLRDYRQLALIGQADPHEISATGHLDDFEILNFESELNCKACLDKSTQKRRKSCAPSITVKLMNCQ